MRRFIGAAALSAFALSISLSTGTASAQDIDEIVVTAARAGDGARIPGAFLKRRGDFVLLSVAVTNDSRERADRRNEIYDTLRAALAAAKREGSIELSVVDNNGLVLPLRVDSATVVLSNGDRPDTSRTTISVKTRIPSENASSLALIAKLRDFVAAIKPVGRTQLDAEGGIEISVVDPMQYRDQVIALFAADVRKVTAALGEGYRVVANGIDRPIYWQRAGMLDLALYIPYDYTVLPATVTSYASSSSDD